MMCSSSAPSRAGRAVRLPESTSRNLQPRRYFGSCNGASVLIVLQSVGWPGVCPKWGRKQGGALAVCMMIQAYGVWWSALNLMPI